MRERVKLRILGQKIKKLREKMGITQEKLAKYMNVSLDTIKNWEQGYNYPSIDTLIEIAEYFQCDFDYLLGKQEEPNKVYVHVSEQTGLSYTAAETLVNANNANRPYIRLVSQLLENEYLLDEMSACTTADYGSICTTYEVPDPFAPRGKRGMLVDPKTIQKADSMNLYHAVCEFVNEAREKNGLRTSEEM